MTTRQDDSGPEITTGGQSVREDGAPVVEQILHLLGERGETLACAESLTGGELAARLTAVPGASAAFVGAVVSYATRVKREVLRVRSDHVVSAGAAVEMARGAKDLLGSDWAVSTTGVAGPSEQEGEPVGTVHIAVTGPGEERAARFELVGDRDQIRAEACLRALHELARALDPSSEPS